MTDELDVTEQEKPLGIAEQMVKQVRDLIHQNIYPRFHELFKPIFARHVWLKSIRISTVEEYDDQDYELDCFRDARTQFRTDHGTLYGHYGTIERYDEDEEPDEDATGDLLYDPDEIEGLTDEQIDTMHAAYLEIADQFTDIKIIEILFGANGAITITPDTIEVTVDTHTCWD